MGYIVVVYFKVRSGDNLSLTILKVSQFQIGSFDFTPNKELQKYKKTIEKLQEEFQVLNDDSKHKFMIMGYLNEVGKQAHKVIGTSQEDKEKVKEVFDKAMDLALNMILHAVKEGKKGRSRICILVPNSNGKLYIIKGHGYSDEGRDKLRLGERSYAGTAFREKRIIRTGNIKKRDENNTPFQKVPQQKDYISLICVPIILFNTCIGVLNIDCWSENTFTDDDEKYLQYFANQLALPLMTYRIKNEEKLHSLIASGREE
ncbi:GAF domain-containing protein [Desmospora activa]|uniref:GAF domain-containing protein n=1 Tax=Desmospora activa TaxID=500615 RepID=UPI0011B218F1|nr:GAF domain-containing protein [Desmospora activa]